MKTSCTEPDDKEQVGVFRTLDFCQSAFLLTKGSLLIGTERAKGRTFFLFRDDGAIKELVQQYFSNAEIPAISYKAALRELKALIQEPRFAGGKDETR